MHRTGPTTKNYLSSPNVNRAKVECPWCKWQWQLLPHLHSMFFSGRETFLFPTGPSKQVPQPPRCLRGCMCPILIHLPHHAPYAWILLSQGPWLELGRGWGAGPRRRLRYYFRSRGGEERETEKERGLLNWTKEQSFDGGIQSSVFGWFLYIIHEILSEEVKAMLPYWCEIAVAPQEYGPSDEQPDTQGDLGPKATLGPYSYSDGYQDRFTRAILPEEWK